MSRGLEKIPFYNQLVCFMPFYEGVGTDLHDISREHLLGDASVAPPAWLQLASGKWVLDFDPAVPEYATIAAAYTVLDFTSEDFSLSLWVNVDLFGAVRHLFCRGLELTDGYKFAIQANGRVDFYTAQGGSSQTSYSIDGAVGTGTWYCLGVSRDGPSARIYRNGRDIISGAAAHINPITSGRSAKIGVYDNLATGPMDGKMALFKAWRNRALDQAAHQALFDYERKFFGV